MMGNNGIMVYTMNQQPQPFADFLLAPARSLAEPCDCGGSGYSEVSSVGGMICINCGGAGYNARERARADIDAAWAALDIVQKVNLTAWLEFAQQRVMILMSHEAKPLPTPKYFPPPEKRKKGGRPAFALSGGDLDKLMEEL